MHRANARLMRLGILASRSVRDESRSSVMHVRVDEAGAPVAQRSMLKALAPSIIWFGFFFAISVMVGMGLTGRWIDPVGLLIEPIGGRGRILRTLFLLSVHWA